MGYQFSRSIRRWHRRHWHEFVNAATGTGLDGVETVEDSNAFILALKSNGTVWGWGFNGTAQLGDGTTFFRRTRPVQTVA